MGYLIEKTSLRLLVNGDGLADNFIKNSTEMVERYSKSDKDVEAISIKNIYPGGFYHLQSEDKSNWMRNAPVFVADYRKIMNKIIILGVNLNFMPLEVRILFFDKFIDEKMYEKNSLLKVSYEGLYNELMSIGFEYSLMEFDASKIKMAHKISMHKLPNFLISAHPTNKYDPKKLFSIWQGKIEKSTQRNEEMRKSNLEDFYNIQKTIDGKYEALKGHIQRIRRNL
jgi:hypothetical protein